MALGKPAIAGLQDIWPNGVEVGRQKQRRAAHARRLQRGFGFQRGRRDDDYIVIFGYSNMRSLAHAKLAEDGRGGLRSLSCRDFPDVSNATVVLGRSTRLKHRPQPARCLRQRVVARRNTSAWVH